MDSCSSEDTQTNWVEVECIDGGKRGLWKTVGSGCLPGCVPRTYPDNCNVETDCHWTQTCDYDGNCRPRHCDIPHLEPGVEIGKRYNLNLEIGTVIELRCQDGYFSTNGDLISKELVCQLPSQNDTSGVFVPLDISKPELECSPSNEVLCTDGSECKHEQVCLNGRCIKDDACYPPQVANGRFNRVDKARGNKPTLKCDAGYVLRTQGLGPKVGQ